MNKIDALKKNRNQIENTLERFVFSVLDERDANEIRNELQNVLCLLDSYIDFEKGFNLDK